VDYLTLLIHPNFNRNLLALFPYRIISKDAKFDTLLKSVKIPVKSMVWRW